jgi:SAM-dependent methyltransferase
VPLRFSEQRPPVPPLDLIQRVVQPFPAAQGEGERIAFDEQAIPQLVGLERALSIVGREFSDFERLLDFGCGPGRYIRHLEPLAETTEIHGADIDPHVIDWLRKNVPYGTFEAIPHEPPTAYPDHHFDLIINHSVFTHLPERLQDLWMAELHRITRPDGVLLLTLHSTPQWNAAIHDMQQGGERVDHLRATLEQKGILFIEDDHFIGSTHPDFYHTTFHAPWYVFERWTKWFDLAAYAPLGSHSQDLVVMRRRADDAPVERPIGHGSQADSAPAGEPEATAAPPVDEYVSALEHLLTTRPQPQTRRGRLRRRFLARDLDWQQRVNELLVTTLEDKARELRMVRVGLYELGQRLSIVSDELRNELHDAPAEDGGASST